jgi:hypothetical protein
MEHTDSTYFFVGQSDISNCLQKIEILRKVKKNKILCQVFIMFVIVCAHVWCTANFNYLTN